MKAILTFLFALVALPAWAATPCVARPAKGTSLTAEPLTILPVSYGPLVKERQRSSLPRAAVELAPALAERRQLLGACFKWARVEAGEAAELKGELKLTLDVDPWGVAAAVTAEGDSSGSLDKLARCAEDVLRKSRLTTRYTSRATKVAATLKLKPSTQAVPKKIARPTVPAPTCPPKGCNPGDESSVPTDKLTLEAVEIGDFSEAQAREERHAAYLAERKAALSRKEKPAPETPEPSMPKESKPVPPAFDPKNALAVVGYNLGAYRNCWRAVNTDQPDLSGTIDLQVEVDERGDVCSVRATKDTVHNAGLSTCLRNAASELWFDELPAEGRLTVDFSLKLQPLTSGISVPPDGGAALESWADDALVAGDGNGALRAYHTLLGADAVSARRCFWHAGTIQAESVKAPWLDQQAYLAAMSFAVYAESNPVPPDCLDRAWPALYAIAARIHDRAQKYPALNATAAERYRALLRAKLPVAKLGELEALLGEALLEIGKGIEAAEAFDLALKHAPQADWLEKARKGRLEGFASSPEGIGASVWSTACKAFFENPRVRHDRDCPLYKVCEERVAVDDKAAFEKLKDACAGQ